MDLPHSAWCVRVGSHRLDRLGLPLDFFEHLDYGCALGAVRPWAHCVALAGSSCDEWTLRSQRLMLLGGLRCADPHPVLVTKSGNAQRLTGLLLEHGSLPIRLGQPDDTALHAGCKSIGCVWLNVHSTCARKPLHNGFQALRDANTEQAGCVWGCGLIPQLGE